MDKLDEFVENLQQQIYDEVKEAYGERGFQRWYTPRYNGRMTDADAHAKVTGECGDTMEIYLKFENNRVKNASYFTDGCGSSQLSGSFAAELAIGKDPDELTEITAESVIHHIGRFPENDRNCVKLAAETLQEALSHYRSRFPGS